MNHKAIELEKRLIKFSTSCVKVSNSLRHAKEAATLKNQLQRSSISSALNYGEAQAAESGKDFIHKLKLCLKELKETHINLKLIESMKLYTDQQILDFCIIENDELIRIFVSSIKTSMDNLKSSDG